MNFSYVLFWIILALVVGALYYFIYYTRIFKTGLKESLAGILQTIRGKLIHAGQAARSQWTRFRQAGVESMNGKIRYSTMNTENRESAAGVEAGDGSAPGSRLGTREYLKYAIEWTIIAAWALWIGRSYLDMGPNAWPSGGQEYMMAMQNQYIWTILPKCGSCFFWNGFTNGGVPSFVDVLSGWLHPISIIATFLFGVFNSGKIIMIASFFMAGIGQWWLGKILKLGSIPRLWAALIMVGSGALTGRTEIGSAPLVQSVAACSLVFPAVLQLALYGGRKAAIGLGIVLGLAAISGQGYIQVGLLFCLPPMVIVLMVGSGSEGGLRIQPGWRYFLFAIILGALIAAPLLVPLIHDSSILGKDTNTTFSEAQPLEFNVLNLVINNAAFYQNDDLVKAPFAHMNNNYVGWVPVIFAVMGLAMAPRKLRRAMIALFIGFCFVYLTSSGTLLKWIYLLPFGSFAAGIRGPGQIQSLAAPLLLGLAGIGLDELLKKDWPALELALSKTSEELANMRVNSKWIMLVVLLLALQAVADFSAAWVNVTPMDPANPRSLLQSLRTADAEWVQPPFGEYIWLPAAMEDGMKLRQFYRPWSITSTTELPAAYLQMSTIPEDASLPEYLRTDGDYIILKRPNNLYASISDSQATYPCSASSTGGFIDVACDSPNPGTLVVLENALSGWTASRDGQAIALITTPWLDVDAPAGKHHYAFRYVPWDAPLGIVLAILGWVIALAGLFFFSNDAKLSRSGPSQAGAA